MTMAVHLAGFFYLCNTGISDAEVQQMFQLSQMFFALPVEDKGNYKFDLVRP